MFLFYPTVLIRILFGFPICYCSRNIALKQRAESNSVLNGYNPRWGPAKAVDGDTNQNVYCNSCLHTQVNGLPAFLNITFQNLSSVNRVEIFYRRPFISRCSTTTIQNDIQNYRFKGYRIEIGGTLCYQDISDPYPELYQNNSCQGTGNFLSIIQSNRNTQENIGPLLEICEAKVYGCPANAYGDDCSQECSINCLNKTCEPDTGVCWNGCELGWRGNRCENKCAEQTFGLNCTGTCRCYNKVPCNHVNGMCPNGLCEAGWKGESCQDGCNVYYYGNNCTQRCQHCKNNATCHHVNGTCLDGCTDGYTGHACDTECPLGSYGPVCSFKCENCFNYLCRNTDGLCQQGCDQGYRGIYCDEACENGTYGYNCNSTCGNCRHNATCNKESGACPGNDCDNGFRGILCNDVCDESHYGRNCTERCGSCKNGSRCDATDGHCSEGCSAGYIGLRCQEDCSPGYYGDNCSHSCFGNCIDTCHHTTGMCQKGCKDGYQGDFCTKEVSESNSAGTVIGVIAAVLVLGIIVVVIVVIKRRSYKKYTESTSGGYLNSGETEVTNKYESPTKKDFSNIVRDSRDADALDNGDFDDDDNNEINEETYVNTMSVKLGITEMKVDILRHCISEKQLKGMLSNEYMQLVRGAVHPHEIGKDPKNKSKNRFLTTFPYDHSLVNLSTGNYINANYIDDIGTKNAYIAAQGPKRNTLEDFWRMVWENGTGKIVMLANLVELGKTKCEQYWPMGKNSRIDLGTYEICLQSEKIYGAYNVRELLVKCKETREQRTVVQFHFTTWPDHGTADALQLAIFQHVIECDVTQTNGPMVVHCSAGIGRTGTFIALDAMAKWIRFHTVVDVYTFVKSMRNNRMNMIQNAEQYIVLHEALLEVQLLTNSAIKCEEYGKEWSKISKSEYPKNEGRCRKEFQKLKLALPMVDESSRDDALSSQNKSKNRDPNILPIRGYRPFLTSNLVKRSNYINAVALPSMRAQIGLIATQYPTQDTVQDFWSLIYDHDSPTIVILEPNKEMVPLFPESNQSLVCGVVCVSQKHEDSGKDFNDRKIELTKKDTNEMKDVDVIECTSWSWRQILPASPSVMLSLIQRLLQKNRGNMHSCPITVVCFNGATKCGLFCSLFNVIEGLNEVGEVDILRYVRQLQIRRPEFIAESAQYEFLYDAVNEHLEQANIYANV